MALSSLFNHMNEITGHLSLPWGVLLEVSKYIVLAFSKKWCSQNLLKTLQTMGVVWQAEFTTRQKRKLLKNMHVTTTVKQKPQVGIENCSATSFSV